MAQHTAKMKDNTMHPRHRLRPALLAAFGLLLIAATPGAAQARTRNAIQGIDVSGNGAERTVVLRTSKKPTFTVFRLSDPMRIVIDLSGGDLASINGPIAVEDGVIGQIATRQFTSDGFLVGRVIVGFERDLTYDVRAEGNTVVIRTNEGPISAVQRTLPPPVAPVDRAAAERFEVAKKEAERAALKAADERRSAQSAASHARAQAQEARQLADRAEALKREAQAARSEVTALRRDAEAAVASQRADAEKKAREAESRMRELEGRARSVAEKRAEAERLALRAEQAQRDAEEAAARAEARHKVRVAELEQRVAAAQQEKEAATKARKRAEAASREAAVAQKAAEKAQHEADSSRAQLSSRMSEISEREVRAKTLFARVERAKRDLEEKSRAQSEEVEAERRRLAKEAKLVEKREGRLTEKARQIERREREIKGREAKMNARAKDIAGQEKLINAEAGKLTKKREEMEAQRTSLKSARRSLQAQRVEVATRAKQVEARDREIASERETLSSARSELGDLEARLHKDRAALAAARTPGNESSDSESAKVRRLQEALAGTEKMVKKQQGLLADKKTRIAKLQAKQREVRELQGRLSETENQVDTQQKRLASNEREIADLSARHARLLGEKERLIAEKERKLAASQKRIASLEASKDREIAALEAAKNQEIAALKAARVPPVEALIAPSTTRTSVASNAPGRISTTPARLTGVYRRGSGKQAAVLLALSGSPAYETERVEDPPRLVVDLRNTKRGTRRTTYGVRSPFVRQVRLGDHQGMTRVVLDLSGDGGTPHIERTGEGLLIAMQSPNAKTVTTQGGTGGGHTLRDIRFDGDSKNARIVIQLASGQTPTARVDDRSKKAWVLELSGATLPKALERSLDTSAYGSVVRLVSVYQARSDTVKVVANLTGPARQSMQRDGDSLVWKITRTGADPKGEAVAAAPQAAGFASEAAVLARSTPTQQRKRKISIDLKDADVVNVIRLLAEVSGENIITSDAIKGKITLRLRNVPWDRALDTILKTKGYDKVRQNNILRIAPAKVIEEERERAIAKRKSMLEIEDTVIRIVPINYASSKEIITNLKPILSERGSVREDARTNTLIIEDVQSKMARLIKLARNLDRQTPQVLIEARIVEASSNYLESLGIQWGGIGQANNANGNPTGLTFPGQVAVSGGADDSQTITGGVTTPANYAVNLPAPIGSGAGGGIGFIFGSAGGSQLLNLRLSALEENGKGRIISSPRITTLDNRKATISQGVDIPISVVSAAGVSTKFIQARLLLEVTPHVTNDGSVLMKIKTSKAEPDFARVGASGDPTIQKKEAETEVLVKDGDTTVIGGIYTRSKSQVTSEVPFFSKIPVLGWLFKSKRMEDSRSELLIFVTPKIVNRDASSLDATAELSGSAAPKEQ